MYEQSFALGKYFRYTSLFDLSNKGFGESKLAPSIVLVDNLMKVSLVR